MTVELAKLAGEALAQVRSATLADAIVMASAARRGDVVLTSDFDDLERPRQRFPTVRVLRVYGQYQTLVLAGEEDIGELRRVLVRTRRPLMACRSVLEYPA